MPGSVRHTETCGIEDLSGDEALDDLDKLSSGGAPELDAKRRKVWRRAGRLSRRERASPKPSGVLRSPPPSPKLEFLERAASFLEPDGF